MRSLPVIFLLIIYQGIKAQHCPWDCAGMIILETDIPKEKVYKMKPVLVDENKKPITDTVFGTGLPTYDLCDFKEFKDFTAYRKKRIELHHWYEYDTAYYFAAGKYIVHYNFCEYKGDLFLRYTNLYTQELIYIPVLADNRIHLHEYNNEIRERQTDALKQKLKNFAVVIPCAKWGLKKEDCK